jgi:hypothetical protein
MNSRLYKYSWTEPELAYSSYKKISLQNDTQTHLLTLIYKRKYTYKQATLTKLKLNKEQKDDL